MLDTKTKPVDTTVELMIHIIKRKPNGDMGDKTLCGKLWDHPVVRAKNICEECKDVAKREGHNWQV